MLVFGSIAIAAPAHAVTVTTYEETDVVVVHTTPENFVYSTYIPWAPEGAATFPSLVPAAGTAGYYLQGYRPALDLAEGCTATVNGFSVAYRSLAPLTGFAESSLFVGAPAEAQEGSTYEFEGIGTDSPGQWMTVSPVNGTNSGTVSVTLGEPVDAATDVLGWIGFAVGGGTPGPETLWSVDSVSFSVTSTCPDPAPVPVAAAALPATGLDGTAVTGLAALTLLALGGFLALARRRTVAE